MTQTYQNNEWLVIINPNAGNGRGIKEWPFISGLLNKYKINYSAVFTQRKGHAIEITCNYLNTGIRNIITIGGDGTLNEVLNGVFLNKSCSSGDVTLALIPVGTGNDWGRMFGISNDYESAVKTISEKKTILHDVGLVSYFEGSERKERYFINIAGLGFESVVVKRTNIQKDLGRGGKLIYFYNLVMSLLSYKNTSAELDIDGKKTDASVFSINVGNGRYCGGGMRQTPDALPDDGMLDVTVINGMGKFEIIRNLNILYNGNILKHRKIDGYRCKNLKVSSDSLIYAEADGETLGHTPAEFSIIPLAVKVVIQTALIR